MKLFGFVVSVLVFIFTNTLTSPRTRHVHQIAFRIVLKLGQYGDSSLGSRLYSGSTRTVLFARLFHVPDMSACYHWMTHRTKTK